MNVIRDDSNPASADWELKRIVITKAPVAAQGFTKTWKTNQERWLEDTNPVTFNLIRGRERECLSRR